MFLLFIMIGVGFAIVASGYKIGSKGGVFPIQCGSVFGLAALFFFGIRGAGEWCGLSALTIICAIISGTTQYAAIRILRKALQLGPLSLAWCAASLNFVPTVLFASYCYGESISLWGAISLVLAVAAIIFAALGNGNTSTTKIHSLSDKITYTGCLVLILLNSSVFCIVMKWANYHILANGENLIKAQGNLLFGLTYVFFAIIAVIDLSFSKTWKFNRAFLYGSICAVVGGLSGFAIQLSVLNQSAMLVFMVSGISALTTTSLIDVFFFKLRPKWNWYCCLSCAILSIYFTIN